MDNDKSTIKHISGLLNTPNTRLEGLRSLDAHLPYCSDEDFIEYCINWMQNCCKTTASSKEINFTTEILSKLFKISSNYPELNKTVSFFITNRFFDHFFKYFVNSNAGWSCAKTCFLFYRGPCGSFQEKLEKYLLKSVSENKKSSPCVSECFALLPSLGGGGNEGVNYKTNWKSQFLKFIDITHSILNNMFSGIKEVQQYDTKEQTYFGLNKKKSSKNYLTVQLYNHCSILKLMLQNSYPAPKCIPTGLLLDLICRGLALNPKALSKSKTQTLYSVGSILPQVQIILLDLLDSLIVTCKTQLLPNAFVICKLIQQTLNWSQSSCVYGSEKCFGLLRISAYNTLCNWLVATKSGGCIDVIAKSIISHVMSDIESKKAVVLLKETKLKKNNISNTMQQSNRNIDPSANAHLCYAALQSLQNLLKFSGALLESEDQKYLQETVVKLLLNIHNSFPTEVLIPYSMSVCRKGLYSILLELVNQPCPEWPPPLHFALGLFKKGQDDSSQEVSQFCSSALNALAVITHQQFSNGPLLTTETLINADSNSLNFNKKTKSICIQEEVNEEVMSETEELENNIDFENEKLNNTNKAKSKSPEANNGLPYPSETLSIEKSPSNEECNKSDDESSKESFHIENKDWLENMQLDDLNGFSEEENQEDDEEPKSKKPKTSDELTSNSSISSKCSTPQLKETETDGTILLENKDNIGDADDINNSEETARNNITESASKKGVQDNDAHNSSNNNNNNHNHNSSNSNNNDSNSSSSSSNNINNNNDNTINCNSETLNNNTSDTICNEDNKIVGNETPEKMNNKKSMEIDVTPDSNSEKSHTPELPNEEGKSLEVKKRYFLRSKTCKGSSEEPEEILKKVDGTDSVKQTPGKGLGKATPSSTLSVSRRPRTRAVSKLRLSENEDDMDSQKKNDAGEEENEVLDDECAFMLGFDDSISD